MELFAFAASDLIFWQCLPHRAHFDATRGLFHELGDLRPEFPAERFEFIVNQSDLPGGLTLREIERFFAGEGRRLFTCMPWEELLPGLSNRARMLVLERPHADWVSALRRPLGRIMNIRPAPKPWTTCDPKPFGGGFTSGPRRA